MIEDKELGKIILPQGILDYFELNKVEQTEQALQFYLEEKNIIPQEYQGQKLTSKGFFEEIKVQDFPIRGKSVYLLIKRRRWLNEDTGSIVFRDWALISKGTRMTKEFGAFLKAIYRYQSGQL